jgi:short-subunit dehydrogenase
MSPDYVADKIIKAVERKSRTVVIGSKGKVILSLNWLSGKITDLLLKNVFKL